MGLGRLRRTLSRAGRGQVANLLLQKRFLHLPLRLGDVAAHGVQPFAELRQFAAQLLERQLRGVGALPDGLDFFEQGLGLAQGAPHLVLGVGLKLLHPPQVVARLAQLFQQRVHLQVGLAQHARQAIPLHGALGLKRLGL